MFFGVYLGAQRGFVFVGGGGTRKERYARNPG